MSKLTNKNTIWWDLGPTFAFAFIVVIVVIITICKIDNRNDNYGFYNAFQASTKCYEMLIDITNRLDKIEQKLGE